jgi:hypothetical protein
VKVHVGDLASEYECVPWIKQKQKFQSAEDEEDVSNFSMANTWVL